uniref:DUF2442 domain-containing protein n=1 Tax=Candidatus Electronema sp. TaxID=2698783 RepID=UPI004056FD89
MSILADSVASTIFKDGFIIVTMQGGLEVRFPIAGNPRLSCGTAAQLNNIEVSPFGLHWPELDEDLSFRGLLAGDYGQFCKHECKSLLL